MKADSLICEQCGKACRQRLPHPTRTLERTYAPYERRMKGTYRSPALICLRCVDRIRRAAGGGPAPRPKPVESLELFPGHDCIKQARKGAAAK